MEPLIHENNSVDPLPELEKAINDEILAAYQYWSAYQVSEGPGKYDIDPILIEHAEQEWEHVELLAQRIRELGGCFCLDLADIRSCANPWEPVSTGNVHCLAELIRKYEDNAVKKYTKLAEMTRTADPVTHKIIQQILVTETEHRYELDVLIRTLS